MHRTEPLIVVYQPVHLCSLRLTKCLLVASRCLQAEPSRNLIRDPERARAKKKNNLCCMNVTFFDVMAPAFKFKQRAAINLSNTLTNSNCFLVAYCFGKKCICCQKRGQKKKKLIYPCAQHSCCYCCYFWTRTVSC